MWFTYVLIGLVAGLVIGAVAARFFTLRQFDKHKLQQDLNESRQQLTQYRKDVSVHLETTNQLIAQLQDNYAKIVQHIADSKMQLVETSIVSPDDELSYLSSDAAAHIRQSLHQFDEKRPVQPTLDEQPKDYSPESSGLIKQRKDNE